MPLSLPSRLLSKNKPHLHNCLSQYSLCSVPENQMFFKRSTSDGECNPFTESKTHLKKKNAVKVDNLLLFCSWGMKSGTGNFQSGCTEKNAFAQLFILQLQCRTMSFVPMIKCKGLNNPNNLHICHWLVK